MALPCEIDDNEPQEGNYTTEDHRRFYQYGRLAIDVGEVDDWRPGLKAHMDKEKFWPNVWFISDHGNAHLLTFDS